eukprot:2852256-Pleurochrysis_carterae.AAC.2
MKRWRGEEKKTHASWSCIARALPRLDVLAVLVRQPSKVMRSLFKSAQKRAAEHMGLEGQEGVCTDLS